MGYMDLLRYIVGRSYWEGLEIVPIVMAAEIMFGIFFNLSFWYKLTDQCSGELISRASIAVVLIAIDLLLIPLQLLGLCRKAGFISYAVSMVLTAGQKYYPSNTGCRHCRLCPYWQSSRWHHAEQRAALWAALLVNTLLILISLP